MELGGFGGEYRGEAAELVEQLVDDGATFGQRQRREQIL